MKPEKRSSCRGLAGDRRVPSWYKQMCILQGGAQHCRTQEIQRERACAKSPLGPRSWEMLNSPLQHASSWIRPGVLERSRRRLPDPARVRNAEQRLCSTTA